VLSFDKVDENVLGLQVPVNDIIMMDFNNSIYNLAEDLKVRIAVNRASW
jgi:hypothetical protein